MTPAAMMRERALGAAKAGNHELATALFAEATAGFPNDAPLLNSAGSYHAGRNDPETALKYFEAALDREPSAPEPFINRAVALGALGRRDDALAFLRSDEGRLAHDARYWSTRAGLEMAAKATDDAGVSYDRCLALRPDYARALHGRARVALERGEPDMVARYQNALRAIGNDAEVLLGYIQALDATGRSVDALAIAERIAEQAPAWQDLLETTARIRWSLEQESDFCVAHRIATNTPAATADTFHSWCNMLAGVEHFDAAADVAAVGRERFPNDETLVLREASHRSEAGQIDAATVLFSRLNHETAERNIHEARHLLRIGDPDLAIARLSRVTDVDRDNIAAWALIDLAWRLAGDDRHFWLHGQEGLVSVRRLDISEHELRDIVCLLDRIHDRSSRPVGQSVRGGSQTRGALFARREPELRRLRDAIAQVVEEHRIGLPRPDPNHPILRHRNHRLDITGSWSVRLDHTGRHVSHIHPRGVISSAVHLVLPEDHIGDRDAGALELGPPPADLHLDLRPLHIVTPKVGHCCLFPSTLYHGTRPFSTGRRLTVAFDVSHSAS